MSEKKNISGLDVLFLVGLSLFILYLFLASPWTFKFTHDELLFWTSITMLFLSMTPDYLNINTAKNWTEEYKGTKVQGLYEKIYKLVKTGGKYHNPNFFFTLGVFLTLDAIVFMFLTGWITNPLFGISYGVFIRAILG